MKKSATTPTRSAFMKLCRSLTVLVFLSAIPAYAEKEAAKPTPEVVRNEKPKEITAIGLWVDKGLGLISDASFKEKAKDIPMDFKAALNKETDAMTGDQYGVRLVTGKQFSALIEQMGAISSFCSFTVIGTSEKRAYLEAEFHMTSKFSYVAIVSAPLKDLPSATLEKVLTLQHRAK